MLISKEQLYKIRGCLLGSCRSIEEVLERLDIVVDVSSVEDVLLNVNVERCPYCDWWFESFQLVDDFDEVVGCDQCREENLDG